MRRHVALLVLIVAIIVAIALNRSDRQRDGRQVPMSPSTLGKSEVKDPDPTSDVASTAAPESSQAPLEAPNPTAANDSTRKLDGPKYRVYGSIQRKELTFLDPFGQPVEGAVVIFFRSTDGWKTYVTSEARTDRDGKVEETWRLGVEKVLHFSYKVGEDWQAEWIPGSSFDTFTFRPHKPMKIWCRGANGDLRGNATLIVTAERNVSNQFPDPVWLRFPSRTVKTDEFGKCAIEGLPDLGPTGDGKTRMPGCRFTITASWEGRTAEMKFDDFPLKEALVIID